MPGKHTGGVEIQLRSLLILALEGGVWSASPSDSFSPRKSDIGTNSSRGWLGHSGGQKNLYRLTWHFVLIQKPKTHLERITL